MWDPKKILKEPKWVSKKLGSGCWVQAHVLSPLEAKHEPRCIA
jgi:hypothetical protein